MITPFFPQKLRIGDKVCVVAPARSVAQFSDENLLFAQRTLESLGLEVCFAKNVRKVDTFGAASIKDRVADLHAAFTDPTVQMIMPVSGGFNTNQLLPYLDYDLIQNNPKILCGFSDITALGNAIFAQTGMVTYSGPNFHSFAMREGADYTVQAFKSTFLERNGAIALEPAAQWSDDAWSRDQNKRTFIKNDGWTVVQPGQAKGIVIGGNLCTLQLLQGTLYFPHITNPILFLEDDYVYNDPFLMAVAFERDVVSLLQQDMVPQAIVIGRFERSSGIHADVVRDIVRTKKELAHIPIIMNVDFGHTTPICTFPIGGSARVVADGDDARIVFTHY